MVTEWTHWDSDYPDIPDDDILWQTAWDDVKDWCVKNRVFVSDGNHQHALDGTPVLDGKYAYRLSLRRWSGLMAEVWNEIRGTNNLTYMDFYCGINYRVLDNEEHYSPKEVEVMNHGKQGN